MFKKKDLVGRRFNKLVVIEDSKERNKRGGVRWRCLCDCGREKIIDRDCLTLGKTKSCGCIKRKRYKSNPNKDLVEKRFNKLIVVKKSKVRKGNNIMWECICDCGKKIITTTNRLNSGVTKSCGCIKISMNRKRRLGKETSFNFLYEKCKDSARNRQYEFNLTKEEFKKLSLSNCYYCGLSPSKSFNIFLKKDGNLRAWGVKNNPSKDYIKEVRVIVNGIDRVDNNKGYLIENSVACCEECNKAKLDMTVEEFLSHMQRIYFKMVQS